jgi:DNA modification methylase
MRIERVPLARIDPAPYNPRVSLAPGDPEYESLKKSLASFGCVEPLVWNERTGRLVGGHQRLSVLKDLGETHIEVSVVDLPEAQEKALNIALNKIAGRWDEDRLAELLIELTALPEFDLGVTGFDDSEAAELISRCLDQGAGVDEDFDLDAARALAEQSTVTKPGAVIRLGVHLLICGDCADTSVVERALRVASADLLFTDPPYNVDYRAGDRPAPDSPAPGSATGPRNGNSRDTSGPPDANRSRRLINDSRSKSDYESMLFASIALAATRLRPGAAAYVWNGHRQFGPMHEAFERAGLYASTVITWSKERFALSYADYNPQTEFCLYGWRPGRPPGSEAKAGGAGGGGAGGGGASGAGGGGSGGGGGGGHAWYGATNETTLWEVSRDSLREYVHPTQKPLELAERAMRNSTLRGGVVFDPFLGGGTTLIASERLGRRCVGVELDPVWCDVIVRRYIAFVGEEAVEAEVAERYAAAEESGAPL